MYLKRKIDEFLINWKNDVNYLPFIVKGAIQIGKTESIYKMIVMVDMMLYVEGHCLG